MEKKNISFAQYTTKTAEQLYEQFKTTDKEGLSATQVHELQQRYGYNTLKETNTVWWNIIKNQLRSPFIFLLLFVAGISFFVADHLNAIVILACVTINLVVGFYQEYRAEQSVRLLKSYLRLQVTVRRNGAEVEIPSSELVPGDIVLLFPGDIVPADLRIIEDQNLIIDESLLTGESAPIAKTSLPLPQEPTELFNATNIAFSGTVVASGKGAGLVFATGENTTLGTISDLTGQAVRESSLAAGVSKFSQFILRFIAITLLLLFIANVIIKKGNINFVELLMFVTALAVSVVPEALPIVTTICLSQGALHLARQKMLVKRLSAVEDLGAIEILCVDKTGTLTENELTVVEVRSEDPRTTLFWGTVVAPITHDNKKILKGFDAALWNALSEQEQQQLNSYEKILDIPFNPDVRKNSVVVKKEEQCTLIVRGAFEEVIKQCKPLDQAEQKTITAWMHAQGEQGNRIIAIGTKELSCTKLSEDAVHKTELILQGLIALQDPIKKTSYTAVQKAKGLGITLKILSGDGPEVSGNVAYRLKLIDDPSQVITGSQWATLSEEQKIDTAQTHAVFARVSPQQKFELVHILQQMHSVGFLGDGINDAPALKLADVGLAVPTASDVAKEAADAILLQKSLHVIIDGVQEGRKVFTNTVKYIRTTLSSNFGNFYAVAISSLLVDFLPMLPLHLLMVNLLSDFPLIALATDTVDLQELSKPKKYEVKDVLLIAILLGMVSTVFDFIYFAWFYHAPANTLQTAWFIGSVLTELLFVFSIRTKQPFFKAQRPSLVLCILTLLSGIIAFALPMTEIGRHWFTFAHLEPAQLVAIISIAVVYFVTTELVKLIFYRIHKNGN